MQQSANRRWPLAAAALGLQLLACNQRFDFGVASAAPTALTTTPLPVAEPEVISAEEAGVPIAETSDSELIEPEVSSLDDTDGSSPSLSSPSNSVPPNSVPSDNPPVQTSVVMLDAGESSPEQTSATQGPDFSVDAGTSLRPYGCDNDAECPLNLHCDVQSTICFECVVDLDCAPPLKRCDGALHRCVECGVDQDCAEGFVCDAATRRCMQGCEQDEDCPESSHECDDEREVCVACDADWECEDEEDGGSVAEYCGIGGYSCVSCAENSDCPDEEQVCDQLYGRCVVCRDSRDCDYGAACDPTIYSCILLVPELRSP